MGSGMTTSLSKKADITTVETDTFSEAVSFATGMLFVAAVIYITVKNDQQLKKEVAEQIKVIAKTSKEILSQASSFMRRTKELSLLLGNNRNKQEKVKTKPLKKRSGKEEEDKKVEEKENSEAQYNAFWECV